MSLDFLIRIVAALVFFVLPSLALAGDNNGPQSNATAAAAAAALATGGTGGTAAATASGGGGGDTTVVGFPNANAASAVPRFECGMSKNRNILGLIAWGDSYESRTCVARMKIELCKEHWDGLSEDEQAACRDLRKEFLMGSFDDESAKPVKLSQEPRCKPDETHTPKGMGVIPLGCPGGLGG